MVETRNAADRSEPPSSSGKRKRRGSAPGSMGVGLTAGQGYRIKSESDEQQRSHSRPQDTEKQLLDLLEKPPTRKTRLAIMQLTDGEGITPAAAVKRQGKSRQSVQLDHEDVGDDAEEDAPAWSRGRHSVSALKKKASRRARDLEEEDGDQDEVDDFEGDLAGSGGSTHRRLRSTRQRSDSATAPLTKRRILTRLQRLDAEATDTNAEEEGQDEGDAEVKGSEGDGDDNDEDDEGSESADDDDDEEEEEEEEPIGTSGRYPPRNRAPIQRYEPSRQEPQTLRRQREETPDEGDEDDAPAHRYPLRDRARLAQNTPPKEQNQLRGGPLPKVRRLGFGGGPRRAPRHGHSAYHTFEDDVMDQEPDAGWGALNGNRAAPGGGAAGSTKAPQPWEVALGDVGSLGHSQEPRSSNVEITPMQVDTTVTFDQVGGLDHYIKALKEMVFLPLVYPELFERFHITPPRGVLFYGPPGTGKTLVARALAASASRAGRRVSFFMRKGADVLSKWVGEAERQLRLLFEEAQKAQPAIIFFDEIDGLAPVRSSKQDQIHNSIVSTLLALMDGLDSRGQVVIIGATNRIDALDGALRRPGRFDRELVFPLPSLPARASILDIHTRKWAQPPLPSLREELANLCVGYCGADLKALCTEASLRALRRQYPQIYDSEQKLLVDPRQVSVDKRDFLSAFNAITPASHRSAAAHARPLPGLVAPVLKRHLQQILGNLQRSFPPAAACLKVSAGGGGLPPGGISAAMDALYDDDSDEDMEGGALTLLPAAGTLVARPRLLICGPEGAGQTHLGPAVLYALEGLPVHAIGLPALLSDVSARSPEEAVVHAIVEARRAAPAILFLPHLTLWWDTAPASLRATLWMLLADLPPDLPLLLFATADAPVNELPQEALALFGRGAAIGAHELSAPLATERAAMFESLAVAAAGPPVARTQKLARPPLPQLPLAPDGLAAEQAAAEEKAAGEARRRWEEDDSALRALRMALREITTKLLCNRHWKEFWEPVDPEEDPEYWELVTSPMDLGTILSRVDGRQYPTPAHYLADVALIAEGAAQYWRDDARGVTEVSRARALEDQTREAVARRVSVELVEQCERIHGRGGPDPPPPGLVLPTALPSQPPVAVQAAGDGLRAPLGRTSKRLRGSDVDKRVIFEDPEAIMRAARMRKKPAGARGKLRSASAPTTPAEGSQDGGDAQPATALQPADELEADNRPAAMDEEGEEPASRQGDLPPAETPAGALLQNHRQNEEPPGNIIPDTDANAAPDTQLREGHTPVEDRLAEPATVHTQGEATDTPGRRTRRGRGFLSALANFNSVLGIQRDPGGNLAATRQEHSSKSRERMAMANGGRANMEVEPHILGSTTRSNVPAKGWKQPAGKPPLYIADSPAKSAERRGTPGISRMADDAAANRANAGQTPYPRATGQTPASQTGHHAAAPQSDESEQAQLRRDTELPMPEEPLERPQEEAAEESPANAEIAGTSGCPAPERCSEQVAAHAYKLKEDITQRTDGLLLEALEGIHTRLSRVVHDHRREADREKVVTAVIEALEESTRSLL